jgi:uncharacterized integral membrane protein
MEWKDVAATVGKWAPAIGAALAPVTGGTSVMIGAGIGALTQAFGLSSDAKPEELLKAIQGDPEANLKLVQANQAFELAKREQDIKELSITLADIQSARNTATEQTKVTGKRDTNMYVLAWTVVVGFFLLLALLIFVALPVNQTNVLFVLFGALSSGFGQVLSYFFGSNKSSESKTDMLFNSTKNSEPCK